jgi:hypothetical protein
MKRSIAITKTISSTKKKYNFFSRSNFTQRSSERGGRVSDFSATRVRVEGVGSPRVAEKVTHEAPTASGIREVEKSTYFLVKMGFSLLNWLFHQSFMGFDSICTSDKFKM